MNKLLKTLLTTVFYAGILISSVFCQSSVPPESKADTPRILRPTQPQVSSNRQSQKTNFPSALVEYFKGDWSGAGKFAGNGKEVQSDFSFVPDIENQCLVVRQKERSPNTFQFIALWSIDSSNGNLVMILTSNHNSGARLFRGENDGGKWQNGEKLVFQSTPELRAGFALERLTFERQSDASFLATYEMSRDRKNWKTGDTQTFTRKRQN